MGRPERSYAILWVSGLASALGIATAARGASPKTQSKTPIAAPSPKVETPAERDRRRLVFFKKLEADGKLRYATCREFADYVLVANGLPRLTEDTVVRGTRADVDRRQERLDPPVFLDSNHLGTPSVFVQIDARLGARPGSWTISLDRTLDLKPSNQLHAKSTFLFLVETAMNHESCGLKTIDVTMSDEKLGDHFHSTLDAFACADVLTDVLRRDARYRNLDSIAWKIVQTDCEHGIHYFDAIKTLLLEDARKKRIMPAGG